MSPPDYSARDDPQGYQDFDQLLAFAWARLAAARDIQRAPRRVTILRAVSIDPGADRGIRVEVEAG